MRRRELLIGAGSGALLAATGRSLAAEPSWRFAIMGDRTGGAIPAIYERSVARIVAEHPEFVINVGDSIEGYRDFWADIEWSDLKPVWRPYGKIPHYFTPGNHDIWSPQSERMYKRFTGFDPQYSFTHRNCHITVLDNSRRDILAASQLSFLEDDLKRHADVPIKMVFFHRPFWVVYIKLESSEFDLHRICLKYGVKWVIGGHLHRLLHMQRDGIEYVAIGSSGASLERELKYGNGWDVGRLYHYGVMDVVGDRATLRIRELRKPYGAGRQFPIESWVDDHPA